MPGTDAQPRKRRRLSAPLSAPSTRGGGPLQHFDEDQAASVDFDDNPQKEEVIRMIQQALAEMGFGSVPCPVAVVPRVSRVSLHCSCD